jgi:type IV pilus biogenesis protein CpaD/CtpE
MTRISLALALLLLAGCEDADPYRRTDVWYPTGANAGNIAAMVANPHDLILGRGANQADARQAATAVDRVWQDRTKPLHSAAGGASPGGGAPAGGGASAAGGQ